MKSALTLAFGAMLTMPLATVTATSGLAEEPKPAIISVSATGSATAVPDIASLDLTVLREAKTARAALDANNKAMAEVLKAMHRAGIEQRDLQTSNFNIHPRYHHVNSSSGQRKPPKLVGYSVSNSLTVRVRDLDNLGSILDTSITLGVNSGGGISFSSDKPQPIIEEARKNAVAKAIAKAKTLTEAAGVKLGRIVEISETNRQSPHPRAMARMESAMASDAAVPIAAGENTYSITVNVRWELDQ